MGVRTKIAGRLVAACFTLALTAVQAQQPIRLNVGFAPGGSVDVLGRLIAERMRDALGRPVLVENKAGAAGRIAVESTRTAAPDGSTLMLVPNGPMTLFPWIFKGLSFDPTRDFTPIALVSMVDVVLSVGPATPARSVAQLRDWMRANPAQASYGSAGTGTVQHFVGVAFSQATGIPMQHIPYKGSVLAVKDVMSGQLPMTVSTTVEVVELHRAGKVTVIAVAGARRSPFLPDVPTFRESGVDVELASWFAIYAPAGLPPALVQSYNSAAVAAVADPKVREAMAKFGLAAMSSTPAELAQMQARDLKAWESVVRASGFTPVD